MELRSLKKSELVSLLLRLGVNASRIQSLDKSSLTLLLSKLLSKLGD